MQAFDRAYSALLNAFAVVASLMLLAMMLIICGDVFTRNVVLPGLPRGLAWSNEISELMLYLITMFAAPWLLREGRHIRVDILLRALPKSWAYVCEWIGDLTGLACCLGILWYGIAVTLKSFQDGAQSIKTLIMPEWWLMAPLPFCFTLLTIEFVLRMRRLAEGDKGPRDDAVSAA